MTGSVGVLQVGDGVLLLLGDGEGAEPGAPVLETSRPSRRHVTERLGPEPGQLGRPCTVDGQTPGRGHAVSLAAPADSDPAAISTSG